MNAPVRIVQLSDTHFIEPDAQPEGGQAYDTAEAFDAVFDHIGGQPAADLVVVTGDVTDHGRSEQYRIAGDALSRFEAPVNVCPGNHDFDAAFRVGLGRPNVDMSRVIEAGAWAFVFADSCAGLMTPDSSGRAVDPPGEQRLHSDGCLGTDEAEAIRSLCAETTADHVFIWLHHPPDVPLGLSHSASYAAEWHALIGDLPKVRGLGGGHTHVPDEYDFAGRQVYVCPSLKNNFSLDPQTWLPPGYRTFDFADDGTITSEVHLVDDERWPRRPYGRLVASLLHGELTHDEFAEIVAARIGN